MPRRRPPHGNLTAALVAVSVLELVVNRWLGHLFTVPACHTTLGCLVLRLGPFLLYLTGILASVVVAGGVGGHLWRGELFPRGVGFTLPGHILATVRLVAIGALTLVFVLLLDLSLLLGRVPPQYGTHLRTSFGFVIAMVALAFMVSASVSARARVGLVLFVLPPLLNVAAFVATQATWWRSGWLKPDQLTSLGELILIAATATSPLTLVPGHLKPNRLAPALGLAAGLTTFFLVASIGRPDLVQALGLYGLHLDLPRTWSVMGVGYTVGLFGFTVTLVMLLLGAGPSRLAGLGLALVALGGYQTASPIELALTLAGLLVLATGLTRAVTSPRDGGAFISTDAWMGLLASIGGQMTEGGTGPGGTPEVEVAPGGAPGADRATVRTTRRGRPIALVARRAHHTLEDLTVIVGAPPLDTAPDATIESHETWLARRPETRPTAARIKTDDPTFDRKWGVYGHAPLADRALRRRVLAQGDATIKLWSGIAAELKVTNHPLDGATGADGRHRDPLRNVIDAVDLLGDLVEASVMSPSPPRPEPSAPPASS
jgi:hypothetical protein